MENLKNIDLNPSKLKVLTFKIIYQFYLKIINIFQFEFFIHVS
jgi:hypothetical protein